MDNPTALSSGNGLKWIAGFLAVLVAAGNTRAQGLRFEEEIPSSSASAQATLLAEYVQWPFTSDASLRTILLGNYRKESFGAGFFFNVNRNPVFEIARGPHFIPIPDSIELANKRGDVDVPPDSYEINNPAGLCLSYRPDPMEFSISARLYTQT